MIGVDWIGTVVNHLPIKLQVAQEWFPNLRLASVDEVRRECLQDRVGPEEYNALGEEVGRRIHDYPLHDGARDELHRIHRLGIDIVVVTFTTQATNGDFWAIIRKHGLPIRAVEIVGHDREKIERCRKHGVKAFLDDNKSVLETLHGLGTLLCLADFAGEVRHWNAGVTKVTSWQGFADVIEKLAPTWK